MIHPALFGNVRKEIFKKFGPFPASVLCFRSIVKTFSFKFFRPSVPNMGDLGRLVPTAIQSKLWAADIKFQSCSAEDKVGIESNEGDAALLKYRYKVGSGDVL